MKAVISVYGIFDMLEKKTDLVEKNMLPFTGFLHFPVTFKFLIPACEILFQSMKDKVKNELISIFWTTLYFLCWFGGLMVLKILLLKEYNIEFAGLSIVIISALVVAKVVLILENVSFSSAKGRKAYVDVLGRTMLYLGGVTLIMILEKSFEARHEYNGVYDAFMNLANQADVYHIWVNALCVFGALLLFNIWSVVKKTYGDGIFLKLMNSPISK